MVPRQPPRVQSSAVLRTIATFSCDIAASILPRTRDRLYDGYFRHCEYRVTRPRSSVDRAAAF
jgi:hypothetical protein